METATYPTQITPPSVTMAAAHFSLYFYAAVTRLVEHTTGLLGSREEALERFPFLAGYCAEMERSGASSTTARWLQAIEAREMAYPGHIPLRAIRETCGLDHSAIMLLMTLGMTEEDVRFGLVFESLQGIAGRSRPMVGLLTSWWQVEDPAEARRMLKELHTLGLIELLEPSARRSDWEFRLPAHIWDAMRGEVSTPLPWLRYHPPEGLQPLSELVLPLDVEHAIAAMPGLIAAGEVRALIVRGPHHNGRRTALGAVARSLERGTLEVHVPEKAEPVQWNIIGPLATLLHAMPVLIFDLGPTETAHVPALAAYDGPLGIVLGRQGGVSGECVDRSLSITLPVPDQAARLVHWERGLDGMEAESLDVTSARFRLTAGNIHRTARLARSYATLDGRSAVTPEDVQVAARRLNRQALDTLATPVSAAGDWSHLAVAEDTLHELLMLESRCRHRERLRAVVGRAIQPHLDPGVRALFTGPSGTGKTLAARLLASALQMDLYRLDLSSVVNKYIGETEKNLSQIFSLAEELDIILLLDEGDSLLTQRTRVQSSNDRYANLETNYLLQRLETFEGILIVTTNAGQRIDGAFQRRMDVVVSFGAPDVSERWNIWQLHLPDDHAVSSALLVDLARRCVLGGGQIRNAALHASLLALDDGAIVKDAHVALAVQREYRKVGQICPLTLSHSGDIHGTSAPHPA